MRVIHKAFDYSMNSLHIIYFLQFVVVGGAAFERFFDAYQSKLVLQCINYSLASSLVCCFHTKDIRILLCKEPQGE